MMMPLLSRKRSVRAVLGVVLGAVLGIAVLAGCMVTGARAADEDEDVAFDTKILRDILRSLGLRRGDESGIEYRERSPLVVPPNRNLPPPNSKAVNNKGPAWPSDPDLKRQREAKTQSKERRSINWDEESRPLGPGAMRGSGTGTGNQGQPDYKNADLAGPMKPSELGYKGGLFSSLFGGPKEEYKTFTGEMPRTSLIEPPSGYRTPSPYQPYGVGREKWTPPATTDRHEPVR